jgi:hypothetical protein
MYNTREAAAYSGHLPQAGVTPQLLDLLAMQKVDADKKAAAQQLAIQAGQANMPTVAQGLEQQALNSARGEIAQKLGLAGLAQQQAPQGPAPQQPPAQGLENAPSALPQTYQEGGIVAFAKAGAVPEAEEDVYSPEGLLISGPGLDRVGAEDMTLMERLGIFNRENRRANERADAAAVARTQPAAPREVPAAARVDDRKYVRNIGTSPAADPQVRAPVDKPKAGLAGVADASAAPPRTAPATYDPNSFMGMAMKAQKDTAALKPQDAYVKGKEEYQTEIGTGLDRDLANQQARIAKREELYARQAGDRPSSFLRGLQLMGKNTRGIGLGGAFEGVSEGIDKTNAGYTTQDIANQTAIDGLNEAMEKARQSKDIGAYTAAKGARDAIVTQQKDSNKELSQLAGYENQAATSRYTAELQARTSMAVAKLQEQASSDRIDVQDRRAAQQQLADTVRSIDADLKSLETEKKAYVGVVPTPENKTKMAELDTAIANARALKQQIMGSAYAKQGVTVPAAAPTMSSDRAKQFQVIR